MAFQLACTLSARITAIGAVSGEDLPGTCNPGRAVPLIAFHGTADPILYFNGGADSTALTQLLGPGEPTSPPSTADEPARLDGPGVAATVRGWAVRDGMHAPVDRHPVGSQVIVRHYPVPPAPTSASPSSSAAATSGRAVP